MYGISIDRTGVYSPNQLRSGINMALLPLAENGRGSGRAVNRALICSILPTALPPGKDHLRKA